MVFDLRRALLKKEEHESARLMNFAFRQRARTWRLVAGALKIVPEELVRRTARSNDDRILEALSEEGGLDLVELRRLYDRCAAEARRQLIGEIGDPTPHRLL